MADQKVPITVARGDGIGPEIMDATMRILEAAGAQIDPEYIEVGEQVYLRGISSGISQEAWDSLERTKVFLKAPITTPQGGGYKSLNVTTRKTLGLYANVRPTRSLHPFVQTKHPELDLVIIRENEEDTYAGIEHRQTQEVYQTLKLISRPGSEKIIRYAFEYAKAYNRKKVTCFTKDNIMKMTDGLFHQVFDEIAAEYPEIENEHWIIDIGAAKMADTPERFDVIVTENLYGDVLSDISAQIAGSVGLAGSANIGANYAMFEAIHGSAPRIAGQNKANPAGLLNGAIMMMIHINQPEVAENIHNAWLRALEDGTHTYDIYRESVSKQSLGTAEFADAVIERLGQRPETLQPVSYTGGSGRTAFEGLKQYERAAPAKKELKGADIFVEWPGQDVEQLARELQAADNDKISLQMISNRGTKVWPGGNKETFKTDHWRCRFRVKNSDDVIHNPDLIEALGKLQAAGLDFIKMENLYTFGGEAGYSKGQGE